jgi:putative nucleotidyltransferase with HDIG domain
MQRLLGPLGLLRREGRFVDEDVRVLCRVQHGRGRTGIAGDHDAAPRARRAEHLFRSDNVPSGELHRLAALELPEQRSGRNAERHGSFHVESARAGRLGERIAVGRDAVLDREGKDAVVATVEDVSGPQLHEVDLVRELPEDPFEDAEELDEPRRAVDGQRKLPAAQGEGLEHPRQAEVVVSVVVRQENLGQLDEPDARAQELSLRALAAVEEDPVATAANERAREPAPGRGHGARRAEKDNVEVHGASVGGARLKSARQKADFRTVVARVTLTQRVTRSLTLLWALVAVTAIVLAAGGVMLGSMMTRALKRQAIDDAKVSLSQYASGVLSPRLVEGSSVHVGEGVTGIVERNLADRPDIFSIKVWRRDGVLAWASLAPNRIGRKFPISDDLEAVIKTGEAEAHLEELGEAEDEIEAKVASGDVLEVYAPLFTSNGKVIGAYEIYADAAPLDESIAARKNEIWIAIALVFLLLWVLLLALARSASSTLRRQTAVLRERSVALSESYRRLEESSLEAIESLNATVEAKDPYTAGHSARVQRIALSIADELGLTVKELDALRFGALFHDIGKIAIPDALLTKPGRLTADEYELMKRHSAEGARIVAKFGRLRESVPIIRHHHERFDGRGYPDGLAGDEIPLAAAIAGLADAWDAMTIERPYQRAFSPDEALAEVGNCRGTQFVPVVVDAFFDAVQKRPTDFGIAEAQALAG